MGSHIPTLEARLSIPIGACESFEAWLWDEGALAVTLAPPQETLLELQVLFPDLDKRDLEKRMHNWLESNAIRCTEILWFKVDPTLWQKLRRENFERQIVGNLCLIAEDENAEDALREGLRIIRIHANHAFGTGDHATTRLMLAALQKVDLANAAVLDVGCGTGILSIAAEILGAKQCSGFDNDPDCETDMLKHLGLNASRNTQLWVGELDSVAPDSKFNVILANVTLNVHQLLLPWLDTWSGSDPLLLGSGIEECQWANTVKFYAQSGWRLKEIASEAGWLCFAGRRI